MKRVILPVLLLVLAGLGYSQPRLLPQNAETAPVSGESVLVIANRLRDDSVVIAVDGVRKAHLMKGETASIVVSNGRRAVQVIQLRWNSGKNSWEERGDDTRHINCRNRTIALDVESGPDITVGGKSPVRYGTSGAAETAAAAREAAGRAFEDFEAPE
ncbi:MAG: hypothetical protein LBK77_08845 [Spirochaetaceae bacterium]|jgi:hypothetical protein|nr:hypothetical protein [Spirochaetaceae bacterium]